MRMSRARRGCLPALTTSCTSSRSSGRCCLPVCPPQSTATAGPASLSPFSSSACSPPSSGTWPPTSAAPLASRTQSRLLFLWHLAHRCQVRVGGGLGFVKGTLPSSSEPSDLPHYLPYHLRYELNIASTSKVHEGQSKGPLLPLRMIVNIS